MIYRSGIGLKFTWRNAALILTMFVVPLLVMMPFLSFDPMGGLLKKWELSHLCILRPLLQFFMSFGGAFIAVFYLEGDKRARIGFAATYMVIMTLACLGSIYSGCIFEQKVDDLRQMWEM